MNQSIKRIPKNAYQFDMSIEDYYDNFDPDGDPDDALPEPSAEIADAFEVHFDPDMNVMWYPVENGHEARMALPNSPNNFDADADAYVVVLPKGDY